MSAPNRSAEERENPAGEAGPASEHPTPVGSEKTGRNEPCPCGSGKKYKKCCLPKDEENVRQAAAAQDAKQQLADAGALYSTDEQSSGLSVQECLDLPPLREGETQSPIEVELKLDRLWNDFEAVAQPTVAQMNEFLSELLSLESETTDWGDVVHRFGRLSHPDLPGVFRRIADAVPHTEASGMAFFYWAAAEEFTRRGAPHLLPEVAAGFRRLDVDNYDPDALSNVEDLLLAAGFDAETLQLAEHFLPVERVDEDLMPYAVPRRCGLIFELRVGQALRERPPGNGLPDTLAKQLRTNIEAEIHEDSGRLAAEIIAGARSDAPWEKSQFELVTGDISKDDAAWQDCLRLFGTLIRIAREAWLLETRPPGCSFRGLSLLLKSVYDWKNQRGRKSKKTSNNLLDYLGPSGLEGRLAQSCCAILGVNVPRARLLLQAHELLAHSAARHQLITPEACAQTEKELLRLRRQLGQ
jgi:hypothetical protein